MKNRMTRTVAGRGLFAALLIASGAHAQVLTTESFPIGSGASGSCMIMSDGTTSSGGAVGVQGSASTKKGGGSPLAANATLKYGVGATVDSLNATYGLGNWTVANPKLTLQYTLYSTSTSFGGGAGTFDIYWVGKDNWVQGSVNPVYATTAAGLQAWSGGQADLGSQAFTWTTPGYTGTAADTTTGAWVTDKTGIKQATISFNLGLDSTFVSDITGASAALDPNLSLYLMATSSGVGMTAFTGGGTSLPTLSFDVVSVPEPSAVAITAVGLGLAVTARRWRRGT